MSHFRRLATLIMLLPASMLPAPRMALAQEGAAAGLTILVRDSTGAPTAGVILSLYIEDTSPIWLATVQTGSDGIALIETDPGSYLLVFEDGLGGMPFVPPSEQNAGLGSSGSMGGFRINLEPGQPQTWLFTFVITQTTDGRLLPLWDVSRSMDRPPQPFTYDGQLDEEIHLPEEAGAIIPSYLPTPPSAPDIAGRRATEPALAQALGRDASGFLPPTQPGPSAPPAAPPPAVNLTLPIIVAGASLLGLLALGIHSGLQNRRHNKRS